MKSLCSQSNNTETHAFRIEEKKYKAYRNKKDNTFQKNDFSQVIDFKNIELNSHHIINLIIKTDMKFRNKNIYSLKGYDGFYFIPDAIDKNEQIMWIKKAGGEYLLNNPSNLTESPQKKGFISTNQPYSND